MGINNGGGIELLEETEVTSSHMPLYKIIMHNDDKTTMEFVVEVLITIFKKSPHEAFNIMMNVHERGQELVGVYTKEYAEFKIEQTHSLARTRKFPLTCTMEEA